MLRICSLLVLLAGPALADVSGRVRVIDGDTLKVGDTTVRLHGIDAPEDDQMCGGQGQPAWRCGAWVSREVRARYQDSRATCAVVETDRYGRAVARCMVEGQDIGRALVTDGLAFAFRRYSMEYDLDEKGAVVRGVGLHATGIQAPAEFRAASRQGQAAQRMANAPEGCTIKGNVSASGKRIYHVPGQSYYDATVVSERKGERWFCSESEAQAAGWRRARR